MYLRDISTVSVPNVPYDIWNGTRFLFKKDLFPDKLKDLEGKTLLATSFELPPFIYPTDDGGWAGWEYNVIQTLAQTMNFTIDIQPPPNGELWGENKNGSFTGLVGQLQRERSDVGWANVYMVPDRMKYIDYTDPYMIEYAQFMLSMKCEMLTQL